MTAYINLYSNNFSGSLPEGLGWQNLFYLDLGRNSFAGTLPQDMDNYIALRHLHLDHNQFNGTIPDVLPYVGSDRLEQLSLDHNDFTGEFPGAWSFSWYMGKYGQIHDGDSLEMHLTSLIAWLVLPVALTLNNNSLTAPLPSDVCDMNVFEGGAMVEMGADCDVCVCSYPFCQSC